VAIEFTFCSVALVVGFLLYLCRRSRRTRKHDLTPTSEGCFVILSQAQVLGAVHHRVRCPLPIGRLETYLRAGFSLINFIGLATTLDYPQRDAFTGRAKRLMEIHLSAGLVALLKCSSKQLWCALINLGEKELRPTSHTPLVILFQAVVRQAGDRPDHTPV
jgi:hypothetical protein